MGRKRRFSGQFGGVLKGLDLVWESATPPTHIWERSPKKKRFFFLAAPLSCCCCCPYPVDILYRRTTTPNEEHFPTSLTSSSPASPSPLASATFGAFHIFATRMGEVRILLIWIQINDHSVGVVCFVLCVFHKIG